MPVFLSDTHVHAYAGSRVTADGSNQRLIDIITSMDLALAYAAETRQSIIHCGDLFHDRKGVRPEVLHWVGDWLLHARALKVPLFILAGNHDMSINGDGTSSIRGLVSAATIIDRECVHRVDGFNIAFLPYTDDPKHVRQYTAGLTDCAGLVAHLGLGDPKHADAIPADYEVPGAINVADLNPQRFTQVFLGHYHNHQQVIENVWYVGSPLQLSFKEAGQRKGFMTWTPGSPPELLENISSPRFIKAEGDVIPPEARPIDHVWLTGVDRASQADISTQAEERVGVTRVDIARRESVAARIASGTKGADLLRSYVKTVAPQESPAEVEELIAVGLDLITHTS